MVDFFDALVNKRDSLMYTTWGDRVIVSGDYHGTTKEIEEFLRHKRMSKLEIGLDHNFWTFPCVTFVAELKVRCVGVWNISSIGRAIQAMIVLRSVSLYFAENSIYDHSITNAIATHPSLKRIGIHGCYGDNIKAITRANPRITSYTLGQSVDLDYEYGSMLASAKGIARFWTTGEEYMFLDGDFIRFAENNRSIESLGLNVLRASEVIAALDYFDSMESLRINCKIWDDTDDLERAIIRMMARCHPSSLAIYDGRTHFYHSTMGQFTQPSIWPNCYAIRRRDLPGWNYEWSAPICDVDVHASNC